MDPYDILELKSNATKDEIRSAYKRLAMIYHPDKNTHNPTYDATHFQNINKAYTSLSNSSFKYTINDDDGSNFDLNSIFSSLKNMNIGSNISQSFFKEASLFTQFFKNNQEKVSNNISMDHININLNIDLLDIYNGIIKYLDYPHTIKCKICLGLGIKVSNGDFNDCWNCNGTKYILETLHLKINSNEKVIVFHGKSNEISGKKTGDIIIRIYPKQYYNSIHLFIINQYDLLYQLPIHNFKDPIKKNIKLLNNTINIDLDILPPYNSTMIPYTNLGLLIPYPNDNEPIRGTLFIQLIIQ